MKVVTATLKIEYKDYTMGYAAGLDDMADIFVRKKGSTKMMIGRIKQMPEEDLRQLLKQW